MRAPIQLQWPFIFFPVAKWCINEYHHSVNFPSTEKLDFKKCLQRKNKKMPFNHALHLIWADFYIRYPPVQYKQESITLVNAFFLVIFGQSSKLNLGKPFNSTFLKHFQGTGTLIHLRHFMRVWCPSNGKLPSSQHGLRCHYNQTWLLELCA